MNNFDLTKMKDVDVRTVDRSTLRDINDVVIDNNMSQEEKRESFFEQIGNPYCYKFGEWVVKISFRDDAEVTLEERLEQYLSEK